MLHSLRVSKKIREGTVHQDRRKPEGIKSLQDNLKKREKVESYQEKGKKVEGEETDRGCFQGIRGKLCTEGGGQ